MRLAGTGAAGVETHVLHVAGQRVVHDREHAHLEIVEVQYRRQLSLRHQRAVDETKLGNLDKLLLISAKRVPQTLLYA